MRFTLLTAALAVQTTALVDRWTPEGFDWAGARVDVSKPGGWMNASQIPATTDLALVHIPYQPGVPQNEIIAPIIVFAGYAYRAVTIAAAGIALKNLISTCRKTIAGEASAYECAEGTFTTALAFGGAYSAGKQLAKTGGRLLFPSRARPDGTFDLEMNVLTKRGLKDGEINSQMIHNDLVHNVLRSISKTEPEFIDYADDDHRLTRREGGLHPLVPMYRFNHFKHGPMELTARDTVNGTWITIAPSGHSTHLLGKRRALEWYAKAKRQEVYDHEGLMDGAVEARFDTEASQADPAQIGTDAQTLFNVFEPETECFMKGAVADASVLDVQMYDQTNAGTFGFASLGIFNDVQDADTIENLQPAGMPLPQPKC